MFYFPNSWKTLESQRFSEVFQELEKWNTGLKWVNAVVLNMFKVA